MSTPIYTTRHIELSFIPAFGLTVGYEHQYREIAIIFGCFLLTIEFKRKKTKKRK